MGIRAANLDVAAVLVALVHILLARGHICGVAAIRIVSHIGDHAANLKIGIDAAPKPDRASARDKLMVQALEAKLWIIYLVEEVAGFLVEDSQTKVAAQRHGTAVDLVKGKPMATLLLIFLTMIMKKLPKASH